ncbi:MAG: cold-shock protein [Gammaproteobacteria bacterium]|nr:cold-shock protein [Gammaproteobacteria bacterium]
MGLSSEGDKLGSVPAKSKPKAKAKAKAATPSSPSAAVSGSRDEGVVKWFNSSKGFGFITRSDGQDVFVHFRSIRGEGRRFLRDGQSVQFETGQGDKGLQAEDVVVLDS